MIRFPDAFLFLVLAVMPFSPVHAEKEMQELNAIENVQAVRLDVARQGEIDANVKTSTAEELPSLPEAFDAGWQGKKTCALLYETESVRVGRCVFPPGVGHEKHFHYPHFGYVLEGGKLSITDEAGVTGERQTISGKSWSTDKITVHEALNIGDTITSYLIVEPKQ